MEHGEFGFGNKCPFITCGRCGADKEAHLRCKTQGGVPMSMGVMCTLTEEEGSKPSASRKYDAVLVDRTTAPILARHCKNESKYWP